MALRIKDSVDLKELEKFGFHISGRGSNKFSKTFITNDMWCDTMEIDINNIISPSHAITDNNLKHYQDTLYDLIKANLIEKVEDK